MKVCIPTEGEGGLEDRVSEHFGRSSTFTIVDLDTGDVKVIENRGVHMGGKLYPSEILAKEGINAMLCKGLGIKALNRFEELGIDVYIGADGKVRDVIDSFKAGKLRKASLSDACLGHHREPNF